MQIEITKQDLITLITSNKPSLSLRDDAVINLLGYSDYKVEWSWNLVKLNRMTEEGLFSVLEILRKDNQNQK